MRKSAYDRYCSANPTACPIPALGTSLHPSAADVWINAINLQVQMHLRNLYAHLLENHYLAPIVGYDSSIMEIFSRDVLNSIKIGKPGWENMLPEKAAAVIKERRLFGYKEPEVAKLEPVAP
jgi:hypothetical protein